MTTRQTNPRSKVSQRGQTVIPNEVRKALNITPGATLTWEVTTDGLFGRVVVHVTPADPVRALRGILKGVHSTEDLLEERRLDREREEEKYRRWSQENPQAEHEHVRPRP